MAVTSKTIKLYRGDDETRLVGIKGELDFPFIQRIDLHAVAKSEKVFSLSTTDKTIQIVDEGILLDFTHNLTKDAEWKTADYDLQITFKDNRIKTILRGTIELTHDFTRGTENG